MNFRLPITLLIALTASTFLSATGHCQPVQLSFTEAWELAQSHNSQIRQANYGVEKAKAQIGEAYAGALPSLTATGYYQRNFIIPEMVSELPPRIRGGNDEVQIRTG